MKRMLIALSALLCVFTFSVAYADSTAGSGVYQSICQGCHGADGSKVPAAGVSPLKGQSSETALQMLQGYKAGTFGGDHKQTMQGVVGMLTDQQMQDLADYIATF